MENNESADRIEGDGKQERIEVPKPEDQPTGKKAEKKPEDPPKGEDNTLGVIRAAEHRMIWLTAAMAFFALCGVVVGVLQWITSSGQKSTMDQTFGLMFTQTKVMQGQLEQMKGSSAQTNKLITSGGISADAAKSTADTASKQLEMAERPWISTTFAVKGPLTFSNKEGRIIIGMTPNNTGHSPAVQVEYEMKFVVPFLETPDPARQRDQLCRDLEGRSALPHNRRFHQTWFPGQQPEIAINLPISEADIRAGMVDIPKALFPANPPKPPNIWPVLLACVAYRSNFISSSYATGYIFDLFQVDESGKVVSMEPKGQFTRLVLREHFGTGAYAK